MPLDIGIGLLAGVIAHYVFGFPLVHAEILGVGFMLLPDLDGVIQAVRKGSLTKMDTSHRDGLHVPLIYVPVGTALCWLVVDWRVAVMFAVLSLAHFLHDSIGTGWGIAWLRPIKNNYYKFFSEDKGDASFTGRKWLVSWTPAQQRAVSAKYGNPNWLRDMYLKPQAPYFRIVLFEFALLLLGIAVLVFVFWK